MHRVVVLLFFDCSSLIGVFFGGGSYVVSLVVVRWLSFVVCWWLYNVCCLVCVGCWLTLLCVMRLWFAVALFCAR